MWFNTRAVVLTSGSGTGTAEIVAFDSALRGAAIADFNLIRVTSIVPPHVPVYAMLDDAEPVCGNGLMLPTVYERVSSSNVGEVTSAAVGVGVPRDRTRAGVIFPYSDRNISAQECVSMLESIIFEGMSELRRSDQFDYRYSCASGSSDTASRWHCSLAALCFLDEDLWPYFADRVAPV